MSQGENQRDIDPTASAPKKVRFTTPDQVFWAYDNYRDADPQRSKRAAILKSYYRYPHAVNSRDRKDCLLKEPSVTNYGMLAFLVDRNKTAYLDMHYSRSSAFDITSEFISEKEKNKEGLAHRKEWSQHITHAFERYFIKEWSAYTYNQELGITDMQLYGRTLQFWPHPTGARSEYLAVERCYPNREATHDPGTWDSVAVEFEITNQELWNLANTKGSGFDKQNVATYLKRNCDEYKRKSESDLVREFENGNWDYQVASRTAELVYFFSKEYEKEGGNQISMHVIPRNYGEVMGGRRNSRKLGFLAKKEHYRTNMHSVLSVIIDDVGHGKFYNTPSFAEKLYVAAKTYDQKMNKAGDAAEINCMLMTEGGDANSGKAMTKQVFRDRIHFLPGTRPSQVRYQLPVEESVAFAQRIFQDARSNAGVYQISDGANGSGGSPKTATQANLDFQESGRLTSANLKRYTAQRAIWGKEAYRRFLSTPDGDECYEGLKGFKKYLKDNDVPEEAYAPENVIIESRMVLGAGSPAAKFQAATSVLGILNQRPTSRGQRIAQKEAIAALNGIDNADTYFDDTEFTIPTDEDRLVGHENEEMRDQGFKFYNMAVHDSDNHELHLFGTNAIGGQTIGHLEDGFNSLKEGIQMVESEVPDSDKPLLMDKIAAVIKEIQNRIQHADAHAQYLATDRGKHGKTDEARRSIAELKRGLDFLTNNFVQLQEARMNQQGEGNEEQQKAQIELQKAQALAEIAVSSKIQEHEFKMQKIKEEADVKRQATVEELSKQKIAQSIKDSAKS